MKTFYLDLKGVTTREELHDRIQKELPLPEWYGRNLDALHDILTDEGRDWSLVFYNCEEPDESIGEYMYRLRRMCFAASFENGAEREIHSYGTQNMRFYS